VVTRQARYPVVSRRVHYPAASRAQSPRAAGDRTAAARRLPDESEWCGDFTAAGTLSPPFRTLDELVNQADYWYPHDGIGDTLARPRRNQSSVGPPWPTWKAGESPCPERILIGCSTVTGYNIQRHINSLLGGWYRGPASPRRGDRTPLPWSGFALSAQARLILVPLFPFWQASGISSATAALQARPADTQGSRNCPRSCFPRHI
jgi:hypothetical protein